MVFPTSKSLIAKFKYMPFRMPLNLITFEAENRDIVTTNSLSTPYKFIHTITAPIRKAMIAHVTSFQRTAS